MHRTLCFLLAALACSDAPTESGDTDWSLWPPVPARITAGTLIFSGHLSPVPEVAGVQRIVALLTNPNTGPATIVVGPGSFGARLYATADLSDTPLWDNRPSFWSGITLPEYTFQVQGETTLPFETTAFLSDAELKRVLTPGTYHVALTWRAAEEGPVFVAAVGLITVGRSQ